MNVAKPVVLIVSHLNPTMGLEKAAVTWARLMANKLQLTAVVIGGEPGDEALIHPVPCTMIGRKRIGVRRLVSVFQLAQQLRRVPKDTPVILAGIWVAIPGLLAFAGRRNIIVWEHSLESGKLASSRSLRLLGRLARVLYRRATAIVCVSSAVAKAMPSHLQDRVIVVSNTVGSVRMGGRRGASLQVRRTQERILGVGSLTRTKNYALLLEAMRLLPTQYELDIYGDGPLKGELSATINRYELSSRVRLHGYVPPGAIPWEDYDVLAHPALGETFGYVLFEAAERHIPVVTLDKSVMQELVPTFVPGRRAHDSDAAFAQQLRKTLASPLSPELYLAADKLRSREFGDRKIQDDWLNLLAVTAAEVAGRGTVRDQPGKNKRRRS